MAVNNQSQPTANINQLSNIFNSNDIVSK